MTNLRVMTVNCRSLFEKQSEFKALIDYVKPDIVCGTESWLRGVNPGKPPRPDLIKTSKVFLENYNVFRNDRSTLGGGVFAMVHKSLSAAEQPEFVTNCEIEWINVKLYKAKELFIGTFYMAHHNMQDITELLKSLSKVSENGKKACHVILTGDFNRPDVNWDTGTVPPEASDRDVQQGLADVCSTEHLTQTQIKPTRGSSVLDIVFTINRSLLKSSSIIPGISDHDIVVSSLSFW